jgi:hypothetical protein
LCGKYQIENRIASKLSEEELATCISIFKKGDAVDSISAANELPNAKVLAVALCQGTCLRTIVGVGAIKRARPEYAKTIARRSGTSFEPRTSELGYVAVDPAHRGRHISTQIVRSLLSEDHCALFATTASERMKSTLAKGGFVKCGRGWRGKRDRLSLWMRDAR